MTSSVGVVVLLPLAPALLLVLSRENYPSIHRRPSVRRAPPLVGGSGVRLALANSLAGSARPPPPLPQKKCRHSRLVCSLAAAAVAAGLSRSWAGAERRAANAAAAAADAAVSGDANAGASAGVSLGPLFAPIRAPPQPPPPKTTTLGCCNGRPPQAKDEHRDLRATNALRSRASGAITPPPQPLQPLRPSHSWS